MLRKLALTALIAIPAITHAQSPAQNLSSCLADNTSGKDRKDLARWVFLTLSSHPEINKYVSKDAASALEESNRVTAKLFTRLLAENCVDPTRDAIKTGGAAAIQNAFQLLGQLAMQELMSNSDVQANIGALDKYIDHENLNKIFSQK